jgi:hypothetical protein
LYFNFPVIFFSSLKYLLQLKKFICLISLFFTTYILEFIGYFYQDSRHRQRRRLDRRVRRNSSSSATSTPFKRRRIFVFERHPNVVARYRIFVVERHRNIIDVSVGHFDVVDVDNRFLELEFNVVQKVLRALRLYRQKSDAGLSNLFLRTEFF